MDEDCISMRNDPIDPLETIDGVQFDIGAAAALHSDLKVKVTRNENKPTAARNYLDEMDQML